MVYTPDATVLDILDKGEWGGEKKNPEGDLKGEWVVEPQAMDAAALPILWEVTTEEVNQAVHADAVAQESMI